MALSSSWLKLRGPPLRSPQNAGFRPRAATTDLARHPARLVRVGACGLLFCSVASAQTIFEAAKEEIYLQKSPTTPTLGGTAGFPSYFAEVQAPSSATFTPPGLPAVSLPYNNDNDSYSLDSTFTSAAAFGAAYPDGTYQINALGYPAVAVPLTGDLYPAVVPQVIGGTWKNGILVLNPNAANNLIVSTDSTYASTSGGQQGGMINLRLTSVTGGDNVSLRQQVATQAIGGLTASSTPLTTFAIPAATLTAGLVYQADFEFDATTSLNTTLIPGAIVAGLYGGHTTFYVAAQPTLAAPAPAAPVITQQPASVSGPLGSSVTLVASFTPAGANSANPTVGLWYQNSQSVQANGSKYLFGPNGDLTITNLAASDPGTYWLCVLNASGIAVSTPVSLSIGPALGAPVITSQPSFFNSPISIDGLGAATTVALTVAATNATGYQWQLNGADVTQANVSGAFGSTLLISGAGAGNAGTYTCVVTGPGGAATSNPVVLNAISTANPGRLGNLSVLATAGNGANPLTVGFEVGGAGTSGTQMLLLRGDGPLLAAPPFSLAGTLADPVVTLFAAGSATSLATNANWNTNQGAVIAAEANTYADPFAVGSLDAALVTNLAPGAYSLQLTGNPNGTAVGTALAELFDDTTNYTPAAPRLINLSTLAQVNPSGTLTAGFVIGGSTSKTVLVRASGPALAQAPFSLTGTMPDPQLTIHATLAGQDTVLAANAGWGGDPQIATAAGSVYAFAYTSAASHDAAVLLTLPPGSYTAQVSSVSGVGGTVLAEVYEVP